jgi:hypothetical protein
MIFNMILPSTGDWFLKFLYFPSSFGIYSLLMVINICLTVYSINKFGKQFVVNSVVNYREFRSMNM